MRVLLMAYVLGVGAAPLAMAALGDRVESVAIDQAQLSARMKVSTAATSSGEKFTVQEMVSDANTIKEYVSANGVIFAVTWKGLSHPDLSVLLGTYYSGYDATQKNTEKVHGQRHQKIEMNSLVVQKSGHMRDLRGRAYDLNLLPLGVTVDEIQ